MLHACYLLFILCLCMSVKSSTEHMLYVVLTMPTLNKAYYPLANEVARVRWRGDIVKLLSVLPSFHPSVRHNPCEHSRINILQSILTKLGTYLVLKRIWNPMDCQDHQVKSLPCNILVNTLESTSFNVFWPNLVHYPLANEVAKGYSNASVLP